ncbi:SurA N-terminal domain-containing protein, partial [Candidatus Margulisiibacteriota bacterium]
MLRFLRKKMKTIMIVVVVLFASSMFYGVGYYGLKGMKDRKDTGSLAKLNGKEIDTARYARTVNNMYAQQEKRLTPQDMIAIQTLALNDTIDFMLILQAARRKVRVSGREVDQAVRQVMEANKLTDIQQLKQQLKR